MMGFAFAQPILRDVGLHTITITNTSVPAIVGSAEALRADTHHPRFRTVGIVESILSNAEGLHPPYEFYDVNRCKPCARFIFSAQPLGWHRQCALLKAR